MTSLEHYRQLLAAGTKGPALSSAYFALDEAERDAVARDADERERGNPARRLVGSVEVYERRKVNL